MTVSLDETLLDVIGIHCKGCLRPATLLKKKL